jgi:hypothetical protein
MEQWSNGAMECWSVGVLECWSVGVLECWSILHRLYSNTPIRRCISLSGLACRQRGVGLFFPVSAKRHAKVPPG